MRKITLVFLFFCLAITTVLAQVTPDGSTNTSTTDSGGVFLINIAVPVSGLSNNILATPILLLETEQALL